MREAEFEGAVSPLLVVRHACRNYAAGFKR